MSFSIQFNNIRGEYGFLSNEFPSPFLLEGQRWRTVEHYVQAMRVSDLNKRSQIRNAPSVAMVASIANSSTIRNDLLDKVNTDIATAIGVDYLTVEDMIMLDAVTAKFRDNPSLAIRLRNTQPALLINTSPDPYWGGNRNMLGMMLMYVRDVSIKKDNVSDSDIGIIFDNLYSMLKSQGYDRVVRIGDITVNLTIDNAPREDVKGMIIRGTLLYDETIEVEDDDGNIRIKRTGKKKSTELEAIVDIFLTSKYDEARLEDVIKKHITKENRGKIAYFVVAQLSNQNLNKFLRIATYNNIKFFSPSELFVTPSKHMLNPIVERVDKDSHTYKFLLSMISKLPEISSDDKLIKEMGLVPRDIIRVNDFSPHYRVVV
jgi:N-glycosidase YbiA